ncbi:uncharacterized protein VTP21DRAFT_6112 [Calcarisporiella thermophila]|uniref:uncharacterized protein n=1 Tax=Calcarisporiella thermophila TaxID=911321 RepID=UPI0037446641
MDSPLLDLAIFTLVSRFTGTIDTENPAVAYWVRVIYGGSQLITLAFYFLLITGIKRRNDRTTLRYVEAKPGHLEGQLVTTTNKDYDLGEINRDIKITLGSAAVVVLIHLTMGYTLPLLFQAVFSIKEFIVAKETQIHWWGRELPRPFRKEGLFAGMMAQPLPPHMAAEVLSGQKSNEQKKNVKKEN